MHFVGCNVFRELPQGSLPVVYGFLNVICLLTLGWVGPAGPFVRPGSAGCRLRLAPQPTRSGARLGADLSASGVPCWPRYS